MKDDNVMTTKEAAEYLGLSPSTVSSYCRRKILTSKGIGRVDRDSVEEYKKNRRMDRRIHSLGIKAPVRDYQVVRIREALVKAVEDYYTAHGSPPGYEWLSKEVGIAKSGISRYVYVLVELKEIEVFERHLYPPGFREKIKELAKNEFHTEVTA